MNLRRIWICSLIAICLLTFTAYATDYSDMENWAYWAEDASVDSQVDCFFVAPTVYFAQEEVYNMALDNEAAKGDFLGASNMERGIYDQDCTMYAPYYSQVALEVYSMDDEMEAAYLDMAYADVREAFLYYMTYENQGRPVVLAGFSQGADMCIRLVKEFFQEDVYGNQLVACYAIGWGITQEEVDAYPHIQMAQSAQDTGVIVTFNTEAPEIETSLMVPETTLSINPLNWESDSTYAPAELNLGACFIDYTGAVVAEIPALTGAYLDEIRGTLIVDDSITPTEYPPILDIFEDGIYHIYDYLFFYRNLQENVGERVEAYLAENTEGLVTRGDVVTALYQMEGAIPVNYLMTFDDAEGSEAIRWAQSAGVVTGYSDLEFAPDQKITREELVTMLHRYAIYKEVDVSVGENTNILSYNDVFDIKDYAISAFQWGCGAGMIDGTADHNLLPQGLVTGGELAAMLAGFTEEDV